MATSTLTTASDANLEAEIAALRSAEISILISRDQLKDQIQKCEQSLILDKDQHLTEEMKSSYVFPVKSTKSSTKAYLFIFFTIFFVFGAAVLLAKRLVKPSYQNIRHSYENNHIAIPTSEESEDIIVLPFHFNNA